MIVDSHVHIGRTTDFNMPSNMFLTSMRNFKIDHAWVSSVEGAEYDNSGNRFTAGGDEMAVNRKVLKFVKENHTMLKGFYWIKPAKETFSKEKCEFLKAHKDCFLGFKMHPFHSKLAITDEKLKPYLDFANSNHLIFEVHTAKDEFSDPVHVYDVSAKYPNINFIMVHMGLLTDNEAAIKYISQSENIYGDTTWVSLEKAVKAFEVCGREKILFGTDAPIDGSDTYEKYSEFFQYFTSERDESKFLFYKNALRLERDCWR